MALVVGCLAPMATTTAPAPAHPLDDIARCESGGNPTARNPTSSAAGTYQFLTSTWLANGGGRYARTANRATPAQQREIAERLYARSGTAPWRASQSCWAGAGAHRAVRPRPRRPLHFATAKRHPSHYAAAAKRRAAHAIRHR